MDLLRFPSGKRVNTFDEALVMKSELTEIPGIGKNMAGHLISAGYTSIDSLKGQSPDEI